MYLKVDVVDGAQLCPHHFVESLRSDGPAVKTAQIKAGDELLQVNEIPLYGESHVTVTQTLAKAVAAANADSAELASVRLVFCRRVQQVHVQSLKTQV